MKTKRVLVPIYQDGIIADIGIDMSIQCLGCKHLGKPLTCKAFSIGIPEEIISGETDHSKPLPDQGNDIVFEPIEE